MNCTRLPSFFGEDYGVDSDDSLMFVRIEVDVGQVFFRLSSEMASVFT